MITECIVTYLKTYKCLIVLNFLYLINFSLNTDILWPPISKALLVNQLEKRNKIKSYFSCYNIFECCRNQQQRKYISRLLYCHGYESNFRNTLANYEITPDISRIKLSQACTIVKNFSLPRG